MKKERQLLYSLGGIREYCIGGVRYVVSSHFSDSNAQPSDTMKKRIMNYLRSDFTHLTERKDCVIMQGNRNA